MKSAFLSLPRVVARREHRLDGGARVYATREKQVAALRRRCAEMEALLPGVIKLGGYVPSNPCAMVEKRLKLLAEENRPAS